MPTYTLVRGPLHGSQLSTGDTIVSLRVVYDVPDGGRRFGDHILDVERAPVRREGEYVLRDGVLTWEGSRW